jgi:Lipocalin-like domain
MTEPATPEQFVGTWRLVTMRADRGDGAPGEPYGPQPLGYITYTADGHMHAVLMDPDRRRVGTPIEEFGQHHGLRRVAFLVAKLPALARLTEAAAKSSITSRPVCYRTRSARTSSAPTRSTPTG